MESELTICGAIERHLEKKALRFHMPGHKGKNPAGIRDAFEIDLTELYGLDNLHFPAGCIARSERLMAEICGAGESFFLVNGSSAGIIASVLAAAGEGESVICARNSHVSLYRGLVLSGARPVYVMPEELYPGICGGICPKKIERALKTTGNAKAVFIVSPTFEGITSDIRKIADITHKYGAILIVDEAHGAHFKFGRAFPETAMEQGADISIQSWHKTLTALGQGSVLHANGEMVDLERLRFFLSVMQTTSPSYAIMSSIDACRELLRRDGTALFDEYERNLTYLRQELSRLKNVRLISGDIKGKSGVSDYDTGKIVLYALGGGKKLDTFLRDKGIFIEMSAFDHAVLMTSFADKRRDYDTLIKAVSEFDMSYGASSLKAGISYGIPEMALTPAESIKRRSADVYAVNAKGLVSAGFITPYPPGIPLIVPGEVISDEAAELCAYGNAAGIDINGLIDGKYLSVLE